MPDKAAIREQLQQANQALEDATGARDAELSDGRDWGTPPGRLSLCRR